MTSIKIVQPFGWWSPFSLKILIYNIIVLTNIGIYLNYIISVISHAVLLEERHNLRWCPRPPCPYNSAIRYNTLSTFSVSVHNYLTLRSDAVRDTLHATVNQMVNSDTLHDDEDKEQTSLIKQEQSWTRMEKILLVFGVLMNLGDGVEIYLPGALHIYIL